MRSPADRHQETAQYHGKYRGSVIDNQDPRDQGRLKVSVPDAKSLLELSDAVRQRLGEAAVVLGTAVDGRVHLVANVAPAVAERGVRASDVVRSAAQVAGGGGGGRDTMAQAGGRDPQKLPEALATARAEIEKALA